MPNPCGAQTNNSLRKSKNTGIELEIHAALVENGKYAMDGTTNIRITNIGKMNCFHSKDGFRRNLKISVKEEGGKELKMSPQGAAWEKDTDFSPIRRSLVTKPGEVAEFRIYIPSYFNLTPGMKYTISVRWNALVFPSDGALWDWPTRPEESDLLVLVAAPFEFQYYGVGK